MSATLKDKQHGILPSELKDIEPAVHEAHRVLRQQRTSGEIGFLDLYRNGAVFKAIRTAANDFRRKGCENLVVLGIGGSALGTRALATALKPPYYNLLSREQRHGAPRLFVMDNIDPDTFAAMLELCPPSQTLYNVISRSGETAETMAQLMVIVESIQKSLGRSAMKDHMVVTTLPRPRTKKDKRSLLHPVADLFGLREFTVPCNVGGRFSVFSPVGMFPAAVLGIDLDQLRAGCQAMDKRCSKTSLKDNPAYRRAAIQYLADSCKAKCMSVMMPYADALIDVADWYRQLWAESLGKRYSLDGEEVFVGQTPIRALGVTDQHSQIQLYREGPNNKLINILEVSRFDTTIEIPSTLHKVKNLEYLRRKTMNALLDAERQATIEALIQSQRPVSRIILPQLNAHAIGQLFYMFEVETAMAGRLYNINVFNQPGVEWAKKRTRQLLGGR